MTTIRTKADYLKAKLAQVKDLFDYYEGRVNLTVNELRSRGFNVTETRVGKTTKRVLTISFKGHNLAQLTVA